MKKRSNKKKLKKSVIFIIVAVVVLLGIIGGYFIFNHNDTQPILDKFMNTSKKNEEKKTKLEIIDINSNTRNVAVMINNIKKVWGYQSGLQDAHIIYEIITEGGITRLMAVFKDKDTARIGSVRSARIYYIDYALENDAIYVHVGGSKEAISDINTLGISDLNGQTIFRDKTLGLRTEHTAFTSMELINDKVSSRKMRSTTEKKNLLNYSIDEIDISKMDGVIKADDVYISYSASKSTTFKYNEEKKVYMRFQNDIAHTDYVTKEQYTAKNIITYQVTNRSYDSYGRQELDNIGKGSGYFITDGYAVPITWEKSSRSSQTVYKY
ncbi:MAG: DUF3048 domain-containing protein, partial [Bacilli bacterium]|nr:DUF3048 domain-containing protein [Bacilli bacterium]